MQMNNNNNLPALFINNNRYTCNIQLIRVEQTYNAWWVRIENWWLTGLALEFLEKTDTWSATSLPSQSCNLHVAGMLLQWGLNTLKHSHTWLLKQQSRPCVPLLGIEPMPV